MSLPARIIPLTLFIASCCICPNALGELDLTAELSPVAGLPGFQSYRITATSDLGNIVGYDFTSVGGYGIAGPMNQLNPYGRQTVYQESMFAGVDPSQDTHFLVNCTDVLSLFPEESTTGLHAAFALIGDKQLTIGNSVPFLQLVTQSAADIVLHGAIVVRRPDDTYVLTEINAKLPEITIGPAPNLAILPVPPPAPIVAPQPPTTPVIATPPAPDPTPPTQPVPDVTPPPVSAPPTIEVPPEIYVTPDEPVREYLPDVILGYDRSFTLLPLSPDQMQVLLVNNLVPPPLPFPPSYGSNGLISVYSYADDSALTSAALQIAPFNSNVGLAAAMHRDLELVSASNSSAAPEPSTCVLIFLGAAGYALAWPQRRRR